MSAAPKLAAFAGALVLVGGAAFGVARAVAPDGLADRTVDSHGGGHGDDHSPGTPAVEQHGGHGGAHGGHGAAAGPAELHGLAAEEAGYRLVPEATTLAAGRGVPFRFRITGPDGGPVQRYGQLHERELHLIVVRRDLTGFQHVHPERAADGTWTTALDLPAGGTWRAFTDLAPTGGPEQLTLGVDLQVAGPFEPGALPAATSPAAGFDVRFDRTGGEVAVTAAQGGQPLVPEPYLGARGHLVALRHGDLGYAHVHPSEGGDGPAVRFAADLPAGAYTFFFDFQVGGVVRTASTTATVTEGAR